MTAGASQSDHTVQAVFSVCASGDISMAAMTACEQLPGSVFAGEFHDYFSADRRPQFSQELKSAASCVALVDCDSNPELALDTMERLRSVALQNLSIVALSSHMEAAYLLGAMRAGCNEFLTKPADADALLQALTRFQNVNISDTMSKNAGRVICFFGAKGGVGTTTLAVHLANNLVRRHRKRTLLIDHRHELGHVALYLGLKDGQYHFDELVRNVDRLDADLLNGFVARHSSGIEVLSSPDGCAPDHRSSAEEVQQVLNFLRGQYEYVILDSSMSYKDLVPPLLHASDEVVLVSTPDVAALRDLARRVEHISLIEPNTSKIRIVINRSTSDDAVTSEQIEAAVRFPVWIAIPNNYADLLRAINAGEPIAAQHRSAFAQQISRWADRLISATTTQVEQRPAARSLFGFWPIKREKIA